MHYTSHGVRFDASDIPFWYRPTPMSMHDRGEDGTKALPLREAYDGAFGRSNASQRLSAYTWEGRRRSFLNRMNTLMLCAGRRPIHWHYFPGVLSLKSVW